MPLIQNIVKIILTTALRLYFTNDPSQGTDVNLFKTKSEGKTKKNEKNND